MIEKHQFAVDFAEWIRENYFPRGNGYVPNTGKIIKPIPITVTELLDLYMAITGNH